MHPHALIVSQDTRVDQHETIHGGSLQKIIGSLKERGFLITTAQTLQDGLAALKAFQNISAVVLDWTLIRAQSSSIEHRISQLPTENNHLRFLSQDSSLDEPQAISSAHVRSIDADLLPYLKYFSASKLSSSLQKITASSFSENAPFPLKNFREGFVSVELQRIRSHNKEIPLFVWTERLNLSELPLNLLQAIEGYIWKSEDSPSFIAGRLQTASQRYLERVTPPFFGHLAKYVHESNYSWHTPGHMGGVGFLKSATGCAFHEFLGENVLRADLSVSVPELGSLLDHTAEVGASEMEAARTFGADRTYFVTNGTSTSNQIVFHGTVNRGDIVLIDRNCHKTSIQAITAIGCIPIYLNATTNDLNIIGPVPLSELSAETIQRKIDECPLIPSERKKEASRNIRLAVLTNSTYDGICYDVIEIEQRLRKLGVQNIMFDEAWFGYARFHPFYTRRHAMGLPGERPNPERADGPQIFATQSTHKVLTALSQGSMIHVRNTKDKYFHERFNEAFMMHTSTSPQYTIIASLDVASRTMAVSGRGLIEETLIEALTFRDNMENISSQIKSEGDWWFEVWQPPGQARNTLQRLEAQIYEGISDDWCLNPGQPWHGFEVDTQNSFLLDPTKVTIYTPNIPASVVASFLLREGIVVEKTGLTSFLVLFTLGITRGKLGTLISALFNFKKAYDANESIVKVLPDAAATMHPEQRRMGIQDFCRSLYEALSSSHPIKAIPAQKMQPSNAYEHIVSNKLELVPVRGSLERISARIIVPYPPAIPLVMPGECISESVAKFLSDSEKVANQFPGFGVDMHGIETSVDKTGEIRHHIFCVKD